MISEAHRRYSRHVNFREGWLEHQWQGWFSSFRMDESYLLAVGMVKAAGDYPWSTARAHLNGRDDSLVLAGPLLDRVSD